MNKVFTSYLNSSRFFLNQAEVLKVRSYADCPQNLLKSELQSYTFLKDLIITDLNSEQGDFKFSELPKSDFGFLGKKTVSREQEIDPLHLALYEVFGTIIDSYSIRKNQDEFPYSAVFIIEESRNELSSTQLEYVDRCKKSNIDVIPNLLTLTTLAIESNGNLIQYDRNGKLYFYLSDHTPDDPNFVQFDATPPDTFYLSRKFEFIKDWVDSYLYSHFFNE